MFQWPMERQVKEKQRNKKNKQKTKKLTDLSPNKSIIT